MEVSTKTLLQDGDVSKNQEELIFDPYNFKNREITQTQVSEILKKYGVPDTVSQVHESSSVGSMFSRGSVMVAWTSAFSG